MTRGQRCPCEPGEERGRGSLPPPPATQLVLPPGRGAGRAGARVGRLGEGPSLLASRGPLLLTFSRSLGSAALARVAVRRKEPAGTLGAATEPRRGGSGRAGDAPTGSSGGGGGAGFRAPEEAGSRGSAAPPPPPAAAARHPSPRIPEPPPPLPQPGRRRASSGDVKGRAVAAPPRALVKKKKKRGNET